MTPLLILVLLAPVAIAGLGHDGGAGADDAPQTPVSPENLTVVTTQGAEPRGNGVNDGVLEGVRTDDRSVVFVHDEYEWYYDVDPIGDRTLLFTAHERGDDGGLTAYAVEWNWVTNETERRFRVPRDTHDVDRLGPHRYVVADKVDHRAYVYNYTADRDEKRSTDEIEWQFRFRDHYPPPPEAGEAGDYTHLNDVDVTADGAGFLLSPRNFNRVMVVDRSTKETEWTLGAQDDLLTIRGQHDPVILDRDPLTVLVGDSLNHRAVEYQRVDGRWERTWVYRTGLNWPRDVDRLPSGNTLITDTANDRVVEVAPNGTVVWAYNTTDPHPYDVERVHLGDEPTGPTMADWQSGTGSNATTGADGDGATGDPAFKWAYRTAGWVLPLWVGPGEFVALTAATLLAIGWVLFEGGAWARRRVRARR